MNYDVLYRGSSGGSAPNWTSKKRQKRGEQKAKNVILHYYKLQGRLNTEKEAQYEMSAQEKAQSEKIHR